MYPELTYHTIKERLGSPCKASEASWTVKKRASSSGRDDRNFLNDLLSPYVSLTSEKTLARILGDTKVHDVAANFEIAICFSWETKVRASSFNGGNAWVILTRAGKTGMKKALLFSVKRRDISVFDTEKHNLATQRLLVIEYWSDR